MSSQRAKELKFDGDVQDAILSGVSKLANAVSSTLGPKGNFVAIEMTNIKPIITKDGVTVAKHFKCKDSFENIGVELVKDVASRTADIAGDGTTTATVLAEAIYRRGIKNVTAGANAIAIKRGMDKAVTEICEILKAQAVEVKDVEAFKQVATISANGDELIGKIIGEAIDEVGAEGLITAEPSPTTETYLDIVEGMSLVNGYITNQFANQPDQSAIFEDCLVLTYNHKIDNANDLLPLLKALYPKGTGKPLLILAEDVSQDALATLVYNKINGGVPVCAVRAPGFGDVRKEYLEDIAALTGGACITEEIGIPLSEVKPEHLGMCKKVVVTANKTMLIGGAGATIGLVDYVKGLTARAESADGNTDIGKLKSRISNLTGGVAVIKIAAMTQAELGEIRDRVEDAICATRAAVAEGIIAGGGSVLARISELDIELDNEDEVIGRDIILDVIQEPLKKIASNAGQSGDVIVAKLRDQKPGVGYNAYTDEFVNMIDAGIIDPVKVTRTALQNASSIAGLLLTTNCMIAFDPEDKGGPNEMLDPTMGMMGGMMG